MRAACTMTRVLTGVVMLTAVAAVSAQVGIAQPAGDADGVSVQPSADAGGVGVQPAGDDYIQPGIGDEGDDGLGAMDYGDPPELGDINIRVPLTLQSLHEDISGWTLYCVVRSGSDYIGSGSVSGEVERGSFSGVVFVPVDVDEEYAPQDVRQYRCIVRLGHVEGYGGYFVRDGDWNPVFRAVEGSTTFRTRLPGGPARKRVVGVKVDWQPE